MTTRPSRLLIAVPLLFAVALAACDSDGGDAPTPADIAGVYDVQELRFRPNAGALSAANVLDTLVAENTSFEILDSGDAIFRYRIRGGQTRVLLGEVEVRSQEVRLQFESGSATARQQLLLPESIVFTREGTGLSASVETRVDLEAYDPDQYDTFDNVLGRLTLRLSPRAPAGA
jgi:hypothetical protein